MSASRLNILTSFLAVCAFALPASAASSGITYQGRIIKPDGTPLSGSTTQFKIQIRTPDSNNCLMYEEVQVLNMSQTSGQFSLTINDGTGSRTDATGLGLDRIFANRGSFTFNSATCASGNSYSPNTGDGRDLVVLFKDETMAAWEPIPPQKINYVPFAFESKQVQGFTADSLLRVVDGSGDPLTGLAPLSNAQYTALMDLLNGNSSVYTKTGQLNGVALPTMNSGDVLGWNGSAWVSQSASGGPNSVTTTMIQNGAVDGTKLDPAISISTSGTIASAITTTRDFKIYAPSPSTFYVGMLADPALAASYTLTWPLTKGTNGQVLTSDGSGKLTWTSPSSAGITDLTGDVTATGPGSVAATVATVGTSTAANIHSAEVLANAATDANTPNTIVKRDASGNFSAGAITAATVKTDTLQLNNAGSVVNVTNPTGAAYTLTLPANTGTNGQVLTTNGSGVTSWVSPLTSSTAFVQGGNTFGVNADLGTNDAYDLNLRTGGTTKMTVTSGGKVGIGTTSPSSPLHIISATAAQTLAVQRSNNTTGASTIAYWPAGVNSPINVTWISGMPVNSNDYRIVYTPDAGSTFSYPFNITNTGNVGIGTTSPSSRLDVYGDAGTTAGFQGLSKVLRNTGNNKGVALGYLANGTIDNAGAIRSTGYSSDLALMSTNGTATPTEVMRLTSGGNVGIGTTSPSYKLDVAGAVNATALKINGVDISTGGGDFMKNGSVAMTGALQAAAGTAALPSINFGGTANLGIYMNGGSWLGFSVAGSEVFGVKDDGVVVAPRSLPGSGPTGMIGIDSSDGNKLKWYDGTAWQAAGGSDSFAALPCGNGYAPYKSSGTWGCKQVDSANTNNAIVARDGSGNVSANAATLNSLSLNNAGSVVQIQNPLGSAYTLTLPTGTGTSGQVLQTNGSGTLSWVTPSSGGTPAGSSGQVQFNNAGSFAASPNLFWDNTNNYLGINGAPTVALDVVIPDGQFKAARFKGSSWSDVLITAETGSFGGRAGLELYNGDGWDILNNGWDNGNLVFNPGNNINSISTDSVVIARSGNTVFGNDTGTTADARLDIRGTTSSNSSIILPRATTGTRPSTPVNGMMRYNSTTDKFEAYEAGSWKDMIGGGSGLTNFTEALTTSSPNSVNAPAASLTASNAGSAVDFVISPKFTGALLSTIPDATATGGNKRGQVAVDFQRQRSSADQVASGNYSVIAGGQANKAYDTGDTVSGGFMNTASGGYSAVPGGYGNSARGGYSLAMGDHVTADSYAQTTVGRYNMPKGGESLYGWSATDPLFVIGNGTGSGASRSTALMVLKNGNVGIGTTSPGYKLDVAGDVNVTGSFKVNGVTLSGGSGDFMKDGSVAMTGAFKAASGSASAPSITFSSDPDTGLYAGTADRVTFAAGGSKALEILGASNAYFTGGRLRATSGTASQPGLGFENDPDTGIFLPNGNQLALSTDGTERMRFDASGNVGIGTTSPAATLDVNGTIKSVVVNDTTPTSFDLSLGNTQYTTTACSGATWTLNNLVDGATYTIAVQAASAHTGPCVFSDGSSTFKYVPANATPTGSSHAIYTFQKIGSYVYVSWIDGF